MSTRVEGQLWIDRNSPYRLKYFVKGEEYEVSVSQNYEAPSGEGADTFYPGNVVKIGDDGKLAKAVFPRDIDRVIGIVSSPDNSSSGGTKRFSISESDNLFIKYDDLENVFVEGNITSVYSNESFIGDIENPDNLIGAPVYWFIGLTEPSGSSYTYKDSSECPGMITLKTPSGLQWRKPEIDDDSLNVGYSNLPTIGHISKINRDENNGILGVTINLHMSGFSLSQEWSWPLFYKNNSEVVGKITCKCEDDEGGETDYTDASQEERGKATIIIRHGLFPNNEYIISETDDEIIKVVGRVRCFCDVMAMPTGLEKDTEYVVQASVDNFIGHTEEETFHLDRRTEIIISTPETLRYSITGRVIYNFNKEVITESIDSNQNNTPDITSGEDNNTSTNEGDYIPSSQEEQLEDTTGSQSGSQDVISEDISNTEEGEENN